MPARIHPGKWRYWMAGTLMVLGALAFAVFFLSLSSATEDVVRVIVTGEIARDVEEPGDFVIFYESRSVVEGRTFATGELSGMTIQILSDATGEPVEITEPPSTVSYSVRGRSGESVAAFSVDEPGLDPVAGALLRSTFRWRTLTGDRIGSSEQAQATLILPARHLKCLPPPLRISVLGSFAVSDGSKDLTLSNGSQRLLAFLARTPSRASDPPRRGLMMPVRA